MSAVRNPGSVRPTDVVEETERQLPSAVSERVCSYLGSRFRDVRVTNFDKLALEGLLGRRLLQCVAPK
jgi:hypothetical protein